MTRIIILLVVLIALPGCATYKVITKSALLEASVRIAAGRVLENNPSWALPAYTFATIALNKIRTQEITNLGVVNDIFLQAIEDDLTLEEQELAIDIFTAIKNTVIDDLTGRGIINPEEQKVYVLEALNWINQVASNKL